MNKKLLDILACPKCKGVLQYDKKNQELICSVDNLHYQIKDGIPELVVNEKDKGE